MPSFDLAQKEPARRGIEPDVRTVRRTTPELGTYALSARKTALELWRQGRPASDKTFSGKRVAVTIDGGRTGTGIDRPGRKTKKGRHRFETPWREPKLPVIYVPDEKGNREPSMGLVIET